MKALKPLFAAVLMAMAVACGPLTSERLAEANATKPTGNPFQTALWKGYTADASYHLNTLMNLRLAELLIDKAMMAAKGQNPTPDDPRSAYNAPRIRPDRLPALQAAHARLTKAFAENGTQKAADKAAEAQIAYDCWLGHEVEGSSKGGYHAPRVDGCKARFMAAMDAVEAALKPVALPTPPPPPPPPPPPVGPKLPGPYTVFFEWNKSKLDKTGTAIIKKAVADAKVGNPSVINVTGHTDSSGSPAYNLRLSQKRAEVVALALRKGRATALVATFWVGEDDLAIPTGPNAREARNRRTVIVLGK